MRPVTRRLPSGLIVYASSLARLLLALLSLLALRFRPPAVHARLHSAKGAAAAVLLSLALAGLLAPTVTCAAPPQEGTVRFVSQPAEKEEEKKKKQDGEEKLPVLEETIVEAEAPQEQAPPAEEPPEAAEPFSIFDSPFNVNPSRGEGYRLGENITGAKIELENLEFPGIVDTVPRDLLDDQQVTEASQALLNVPGVSFDGGAGNRSDGITIRGFQVDINDFRKNGFRDRNRVKVDMANIDRIEVLKGPASVLYGPSSTPAGTVNYITKKPLRDFYSAAELQIGQWDQYRGTVDVTGPVGEEKEVLYRLNIAGQAFRSFRDFVYEDRFFIAPVATWQMDERTLLTIEGEYLRDDRFLDRGILAFRGDPFALPIERQLGEPGDNSTFNDGQVGIFLHHQFEDDTNLRVGYVSNWSNENRDNWQNVTSSSIDDPVLTRSFFRFSGRDSNHSMIADLTGEFCTGRVKHRWLLGTELGTLISKLDTNTSLLLTDDIDVFNPTYGTFTPPALFGTDFEGQFDNYGFYAQDFIEITDRLKSLVGVRYDVFDLSQETFLSFGPIRLRDSFLERGFGVWTPRYGLVYELIEDEVSVYSAYSESFNPVAGRSLDNEPLDPETGDSIEVGLKAELTDDLSFSTVFFETDRKNVALEDPANPGTFQQFGLVRSRGYELELLGELTDRWSMVTTFAFIDPEIVEDIDPARVGTRLPIAARYTSSVWTRYNLIDDPDETLGVSLGVFVQGDRTALDGLLVPSYTRVDSGLYYRQGNITYRLLAENLLDERYIAGVSSSLFPGAPFNVRGAISWEY